MKKNLYYILYIGVLMMFLAGCQDEGMFTAEEDEQVSLTYRIKLDDEMYSRAIGDGSQIDELVVGVFETINNQKKQVMRKVIPVSDLSANVTLELFKTRTYDLVFWAQKANNGVYNTDDLSQITINYDSFSKTQAEGFGLDAFYEVRTGVKVSEPGSPSVTLTRPFAQLGFGVYGSDVEKEKISSVEITVDSTLYTGFKPLETGEKVVAGDAQSYTFTFTDLGDKSQTFSIQGKDYTYLTANYFLVPTTSTETKIGGSVRFLDVNGSPVSTFDFTVAPLLLNTRVNIGKGLTEVWDGVEIEALPEPENGIIHIENTKQLAYLIQNGLEGDSEESKKVLLTKDLNMNYQPVNRSDDYVLENIEFDGGGHTLYNLGSSLFNVASNVSVTNLNVVGTKDENVTHVGTLVNTLVGSGRFTGVTISDSRITAENGAAGGLVGCIVCSDEDNPDESLEVIFDDCHVQHTTTDGSVTEGYFVGLFSGYDEGEVLIFKDNCSLTTSANRAAEDVSSYYVNANKATWLKDTDFSPYDGWLGKEKYYRGIVRFGYVDENNKGIQFIPKWDGTTAVEPLLHEGKNNQYDVYTPFDLAGVRVKTASPAAIYLKADIDMNGQGADDRYNVPSNFTQSAYSSMDDNVFEPFNYVTTLDGYKDEDENYSIYNLSIAQIEQERAAFILYASGTTTHKNINFRNCQTVAVHKPVETDAKAYGAILVSNVDATYTMENVHAYDCKVFALQKVGTLGARISGTSTLKNNSVNNCYVENYECLINERFTSGKINKTISIPILGDAYVEEVWADFYPHGEVGGMYGFVQGKSTIIECNVNTTIIHAFGQNDKEATIIGNTLAQMGISVLGYYLVPGRHVSTMIGNIRATGEITLTNCKVDSNSKCTNRWDIHQWRKRTGSSWGRPTYTYYPYDYIGQAYYVEFLDTKGSVTVDGTSLTLGDCKDGTLYGTK